MRHQSQVELIQRILDLVARDEKDMRPHESTRAVTAYFDPARFEREHRAIFRRLPLIVARSEELQGPGTFMTHDALGLPLLLTRGEGGALSALLNVCRHRGTRIVDQPCGRREKFVCPYHAWTYGSDGALLRMTDAEGFAGIRPEERSLRRLPVAERHGFVWLLPEAGRSLDVAAWLGPVLDDDFDALGLARHVRYRPMRFHKKMNWKLTFDIFLEAYHLRYVHARSIYPVFFDNLGLFDRYRPHMRNLFPKRSIRGLAGTDPSGWALREHANVLYTIFPNSFMLVQPDHASFFSVYPDGPEASVIESYTLLPELPASEKAERHWQKNIDILVSAIEEDFSMGESIQRGMRSGANESFVFGRYEQSLAWFHEETDAALGEG